jgi:hypothetical protein
MWGILCDMFYGTCRICDMEDCMWRIACGMFYMTCGIYHMENSVCDMEDLLGRGGFWMETLQHTATHCNTLQHTATHHNTLQHPATPCDTPQHTVYVQDSE